MASNPRKNMEPKLDQIKKYTQIGKSVDQKIGKAQ